MASVKVAVRVRPFNQRERDMNSKLIIQMDGRKTRILNSKIPKESINGGAGDQAPRDRFKDFTFDYSYWSFDKEVNHYSSQEEVFRDLGVDVVTSAYEGYNACVFAYGQTGSGKTYTMMGSGDEPGLIPRICQALFARMHTGKEQGASYRTEVSYLEIYNERVKDLLGGSSSASHSLRVREHPRHGPYVQDLSKHLVSDYLDVQELMARGNAQRTTAATNMNDVSSRSHAIFTLMFVQAGLSSDNLPIETVSKVHLVDLAGSERADASGATGQRLKEGAHINKSLVTLGSVISALAEASIVANTSGSGDALTPKGGKPGVFIPYRDSVLTWLLKDSLGGNSKTIMIAAVSPADVNYGETLSTLRYANRAKNIINKPTINEDPNVRLIRDLREEIAKLKSLLGSEYPEQPDMLARLHQKEEEEKVLTEKWAEKWRETQKILQEQQALGLRKAGPGVVLDSDMPHLIGIDDDLLSTGVTLYHLKEGATTIGTEEDSDSEDKPDIILNGLGLERRHCTIRLEEGVATLEPEVQAQCLVNSVLVDKPTRLSQGCIILLGGTNMFRYNDPVEAAILRKESSGKSQLNLSRLSMLSFSTQDLAYSTENLILSEETERNEDLVQQKANFEKEKETFRREQKEREQDWEKQQIQKREALYAAQKELEEEKEHIALSYAAQCRQLAEDWQRLERHQSEQLTILRVKEEELKRRMEQLERNRHEHLSQVEIFFRQVTSIQQRMNNKRRQFIEFFTSHHISPPRINGTSIPSLQSLAASQLWQQQNTETPPTLSSESSPSQSSSESWASTSQDASANGAHHDTIREIVATHRKEMSCLEAELKTRAQALSEHRDRLQQLNSELKNVQTSLQEGTAEFDCMKQALALRTQKQLEEIAQRKQSLSLNLRPNTVDSASSADEMSTTSEPQPKEPPETNTVLNVSDSINSFSSTTPASPSLYHTPCSPSVKPPVDSDELSSTEDPPAESGAKTSSSSPFEHLGSPLSSLGRLRKTRNSKANSFTNRRNLGSGGTSPALASGEALRAMKILCQRVTQQKMLIMQSLENDDCDKTELDQQIAELQELQRQYVHLEMALDTATSKRMPLFGSSEDSDNKSTSADDGENISSPTGSTTLCNSISSRNEDSLSRISVNISPTLSPSHDILVIESSIRWVQITGFLLRGAGSSAHFEYEIRINVDGGESRWILLRRYKRFRELHRAMREKYGSPVASLSFPPRVFFTKSPEGLAQYRRRHLEIYLQQLLDTCAALSRSPLYPCRHRITRQALLEFSPFFKKGFFESGKYGTS